MARDIETGAIIDNLIRIGAGGFVISAGLIAPQTIELFDKPVSTLFKKLDKREQERKIRAVLLYMRRQGLLVGDYEHGLRLTKSAEQRLKKATFVNLAIQRPDTWDGRWRLLFFDIPEKRRNSRSLLTSKIKRLGFQPLQQSVWIHPFACRQEIEMICNEYDITQWVTYVETLHIDHQEKLIKRFKHIMN